MFVIKVTYLKPLEQVDQFLVAHREHLKKGYEQNLLLASGPQNPRTGGIIIARGHDKINLLEFITKDPFHVQNIASYEVVEFDPVLKAKELESIL